MNIDDLIKKFNDGKDLSYEEIDQLLINHKKLEYIINTLNNIDNKWCMCGTEMNKHSTLENHIPISTYDYYIEEIIKELEKMIK